LQHSTHTEHLTQHYKLARCNLCIITKLVLGKWKNNIYLPTNIYHQQKRKSKEGMFEDSEQTTSESTAVQTTRNVSIANRWRARGGGRGKEGITQKQPYPEGSDCESTTVETTMVARRARGGGGAREGKK
jgi:hypothetical protein